MMHLGKKGKKGQYALVYQRAGHCWAFERGKYRLNKANLTDLGDEEGSHAGSSTTTEGVGDLETLEAITTFSFLSNNVED